MNLTLKDAGRGVDLWWRAESTIYIEFNNPTFEKVSKTLDRFLSISSGAWRGKLPAIRLYLNSISLWSYIYENVYTFEKKVEEYLIRMTI